MPDRTMNIVLWIVQVLLAALFLWHGLIFLKPPASMIEMFASLPVGFRYFLGLAEILAAIGLILPGLLGILKWLTPLAAAGLSIVMIGAVLLHLAHQEVPQTIVTAVLLALTSFVAYARWRALPL